MTADGVLVSGSLDCGRYGADRYQPECQDRSDTAFGFVFAVLLGLVVLGMAWFRWATSRAAKRSTGAG